MDGTLKTSRVAERGRQTAVGNNVVVRSSVRVCVCVRRFVHVYTICGTSLCRPKEGTELTVAFEFDPWTCFYNYMTTLGEKKLVRKRNLRILCTCRTPFKAIFLWVSERYRKGSPRG